MHTHQIFDSILDNNPLDEIKIIPVNKFILLDIITFGAYGVWWMYKSWLFFKKRNQLDITPSLRVLFAIFYLYELFDRIQKFASFHGYNKIYLPVILFISFFIFNTLAQLPNPFWLISIFGFVSLTPAVKALNFGIMNCGDYHVVLEKNYNNRQILLLVVGGLLWIANLIDVFSPHDKL